MTSLIQSNRRAMIGEERDHFGDMWTLQVLPVHMARNGVQRYGRKFIVWFSLLFRAFWRCESHLTHKMTSWQVLYTLLFLQWLGQYGREIPCYEPTVYTVNDVERSLLPKIECLTIKLMTSQNGHNRPNLTDLEAQCQEVGCDPFCSRFALGHTSGFVYKFT